MKNNAFHIILSVIAGILVLFLIINITQYSFWKDLKTDDDQKKIIDFVRGDNVKLEGFNEKEVSHILDVRRLINRFNYILFFNLMASVLIMIYLYIKRREMFTYTILSSGILSLLSSAGIYLYANADFNGAFIWFHRLFFEKNSWIFSSGKLIDTFPQEFFISAADIIFKKYLFFSLLITIVGYFIWRCEIAKSSKRTSCNS